MHQKTNPKDSGDSTLGILQKCPSDVLTQSASKWVKIGVKVGANEFQKSLNTWLSVFIYIQLVIADFQFVISLVLVHEILCYLYRNGGGEKGYVIKWVS